MVHDCLQSVRAVVCQLDRYEVERQLWEAVDQLFGLCVPQRYQPSHIAAISEFAYSCSDSAYFLNTCIAHRVGSAGNVRVEELRYDTSVEITREGHIEESENGGGNVLDSDIPDDMVTLDSRAVHQEHAHG